MAFLIGADEAGYAPNLGPLVISATLWRVPDDAIGRCLYQRLRKIVCKSPSRKYPLKRLAVADSKALYSSSTGLGTLERGVLAALALAECRPANWQEIWRHLDDETSAELHLQPWHVDYQLDLPLAADREDLARIGDKLRREFERAGVQLLAVRSRAVFPERFNAYTEDCGGKGEALSRLTLQLVGQVMSQCSGEPVLIVCDKHGGRNHYGRLLQLQFPDPLVEVRLEGGPESIYRWGPQAERVEICFRAGGESFLPAALASMTSKYLRELSMRAFNDFWRCHVPDLRPTAGYPLDARRFKQAIQIAQTELGIHDRILWRAR